MHEHTVTDIHRSDHPRDPTSHTCPMPVRSCHIFSLCSHALTRQHTRHISHTQRSRRAAHDTPPRARAARDARGLPGVFKVNAGPQHRHLRTASEAPAPAPPTDAQAAASPRSPTPPPPPPTSPPKKQRKGRCRAREGRDRQRTPTHTQPRKSQGTQKQTKRDNVTRGTRPSSHEPAGEQVAGTHARAPDNIPHAYPTHLGRTKLYYP